MKVLSLFSSFSKETKSVLAPQCIRKGDVSPVNPSPVNVVTPSCPSLRSDSGDHGKGTPRWANFVTNPSTVGSVVVCRNTLLFTYLCGGTNPYRPPPLMSAPQRSLGSFVWDLGDGVVSKSFSQSRVLQTFRGNRYR